MTISTCATNANNGLGDDLFENGDRPDMFILRGCFVGDSGKGDAPLVVLLYICVFVGRWGW